MDNNLRRPTNTTRTTRPSSSPMSAEEKLRKGMKGLSHMSGGSGGLNLNANINLDKGDSSAVRKKVGGVVLDMETIQDAHKQKFETKGRRNNVIILILSLLLVVSLVYLVIAFMGYKNSKRDPNLKYMVVGEGQWVVDGGTKTQIVMAEGALGGQLYTINSKLNITTTDSVSLYIEIKVLYNGEEVLISGLQGAFDFVRVKDANMNDTNKFRYNKTITGGGTIQVFDEIDFTENEQALNTEDLVIEITAYIEKL